MVSEGHHTLCPLPVTLLLAFHSLCAIQIEKTSDKLVPKVQQWRLSVNKQSFWPKKLQDYQLTYLAHLSFLFFSFFLTDNEYKFFFMNSRVWLLMYGAMGLHGDCTFSGKWLEQATKQYFVQNSLFCTFIRIYVQLFNCTLLGICKLSS